MDLYDIIQILPPLVLLVLIGITWGINKTKVEALKEDMKKCNTRITLSDKVREGLKVEYLTEKEHDLVCDSRTLRVEKHVTKAVTDLRDELLKALYANRDAVLKEVKNNK